MSVLLLLNNKPIHPACPVLWLFSCLLLAALIYGTADAVIGYFCQLLVMVFNMLNFTSIHDKSAKLDGPAHPTHITGIGSGIMDVLLMPLLVLSIVLILEGVSLFLCVNAHYASSADVSVLLHVLVCKRRLRDLLWSQFAPSRQSVFPPECVVLSGVSLTELWRLLRNNTPLEQHKSVVCMTPWKPQARKKAFLFEITSLT